MELWKVGELAARTGVSVRTLHHYDAIGLLVPSHRGHGAHRLYTARDLARLQRIVALKSLGLALDEIGACLERPGAARELLRLQLERVRARIADEERLARQLEALDRRLADRDEASVDDVVETMEVLTMFEKYYTPEQLERLRSRADELGPEKLAAVRAEWPRLIAEMRAAMERGADPAAPEVQALARRWSELVQQFTGGDAAVARFTAALYRGEPQVAAQNGLDPALFAYVARAQAARDV
jgi:MerR family transcriptional regulator, thiopeptide resistance regulator